MKWQNYCEEGKYMNKTRDDLSILNSEHDAFWFYDFSDQRFSFSPAWSRLFGVNHEEELGRDFFSQLLGKGEISLNDIIEEYSVERRHHSQVFIFRRAKGILWIEDIGFLLDTGKSMGIFGHSRDITLIHSFKNRNQLIEQMGKGMDICLWEINFKDDSISLDFPGVEKNNTIIPLDEQYKMLYPEDRDAFRDQMQFVRDNKGDFRFEGRVSIHPVSEKWKWIRSLGTPKFENEEVIGIAGFSFVIDVERESDYKIAALNEELNQSKVEIHKSYADQQQFVSDVTLEMRPPIDLIISGLQLLEGKCETEENLILLESIKGATFGLLKLVSGLSEVTKLQALNGGPGNDRFDIKKIVANTTELVNLGLNMGGKSNFSFLYSSQPPMMIFGHLERIKKLLSHLVAMLIDEVKDGLIEVNIETSKENKNRTLTISYAFPRDPENEHFDAIQFFEEYIRKGESGRLGMKSFDFGLTILRKYADMAGAELVIEDKDAKRLYSLVFPFRPDFGAGEIEQSVKGRILVVDDIELNRELMGMYLEELDCEILEAENGVEAVALFQKYQFDLVLMDLQMPKMSGYDAIILMREIEAKSSREATTIVAISAYAINDEVEKCVQLGFDCALDKPVPKERILGLVNDSISKHKKQT